MQVPFDAARDEAHRLQVLRSYGLMDSPAEESFDRITRLAARVFDVPIALVSVIDAQRQWFKSRVGVELCETDREIALCVHVIQSSEMVVAPDTRNDPRFASNPLVTGAPHIRFYAGAPLRMPEGATLGTLCLIDVQPRQWSEADGAQLRDLAAMVVNQIVLRRDENLYRSLIESGSDMVTVFNAEGVVFYQSPSSERNLGYERGELVGCSLFDLVHPDDRDAVQGRFAEMIETRRDMPLQQFRVRHKDGSWHTLESHARCLLDDPHIAGIVAISRDVSERVRIEEQLNFSEQRFEAAFDQSSIGMALVAPTGTWLRCNDALCEILGYDKNALIATDFQSLTHPDDLEANLKLVEQTLRGERANYTLDKRYLHRDGHYLWAQLSVSLVRDDDGTPHYFVVQIQDIDARKKQEERLRLLESVAVNAQDAILITEAEPIDEPGPRILYVNDAYTRMTGYSLEEVLGKTPRITQGPETDPAARAVIRHALEHWKPVVTEILNYRKDGTPFWIELSISPVADENGWFTHWVSLQRDINARKETEVKLLRISAEAEFAREEAEAANRAKSEFLSRMSHELRTPLNAILGFGQLLELEEQNAANRESTQQILKAGRHLLELINDVLDISRIETGKMLMSIEPVSVADVAREMFDLVRPLAAEHRVTLRENGTFNSTLCMLGDRRCIKQIVLNLLSNAIKYNRVGGHVELRLEVRGARVRLCVCDTGPGIAPEKRGRLWVPFDRLGAEMSGIEGTGIGLALSRRLAQAMDGTLEVDLNGTQGSTFWLELPLAQTALVTPADSLSLSPHNVLPAATRYVALYIDDNHSNVQLMQGVLARRPEVRLLTAFQGGLGLELARHYRPDIILLDLHLPDINGDEVLRLLRADAATRDIPVMVVSADATPHQSERLIRLGANAFIAKPFDVLHFLHLMDDLLGKEAPVTVNSVK